MWRAKMAWVRIAPCLFVAFALPVLASGVVSHPSGELRRCGLLLLFERTHARFARPGARWTSMGALTGDGPFPISPG